MKHDTIIAHEGYPFIIFSLVITVFVAFLGICWLFILAALITFLLSGSSAIRSEIFCQKKRLSFLLLTVR
jgi:hypothetical protein